MTALRRDTVEEVAKRGEIRAQLTSKPCPGGGKCFDLFCLDDHNIAACPECKGQTDYETLSHLRMCESCFCPACGGTCAELREALR